MIILINALKRTVVITFCVAFSTLNVRGQESSSPPPRHAAKLSALHLINPELASVQVAYEYRFTEKFSAQVEGGYVFGGVWWSYPSEKGKGIKLKQELRWYFYHMVVPKRFYDNVDKGMYLSIEFHQNRMEFIKNRDSPYRQNGKGIKVGFVRYSPWGFMFDVYFGFSFAKTNMGPLGIPLNNYQEGHDGYRVVLPIIGFQLGHWLK